MALFDLPATENALAAARAIRAKMTEIAKVFYETPTAPKEGADDPAVDAAFARETTIRETAKYYNVTLRTLRFYEDRGLIQPRRAGSARFYSGLERIKIEMILNGKRLGFTLAEIAELIETPDPNLPVVSDFESRLEPHEISVRLDRLERQRREIDEAIARLRATTERQLKLGAA